MDEVVYLMLYQDLHMNSIAATLLTRHIVERYQKPAPPAQTEASLEEHNQADAEPKQPTANSLGDPRGSLQDKAYPPPTPEQSGWRFEEPPQAQAIDNRPGTVRFRIQIDDDGEVESVTKVEGNVSVAQEALCRESLLKSHFAKTNSHARAATGYFTFRFNGR